MTGAVDLLSQRERVLVDAIAARVVQMLDERAQLPAAGLVDAATLARLLGVSRSTVYEKAVELGAVQVGAGSRPRLRFDPEKARRAWTVRSGSEGSQVPRVPVASGVSRRRRSASLGSEAFLLPVKGRSDGREEVAA